MTESEGLRMTKSEVAKQSRGDGAGGSGFRDHWYLLRQSLLKLLLL